VYALVPAGFVLLGLQGVSEVIKRLAFLRGRADDPGRRQQDKSAEQELADAIREHSGQGGQPTGEVRP